MKIHKDLNIILLKEKKLDTALNIKFWIYLALFVSFVFILISLFNSITNIKV